jgi:hypothetical protein
MIEFSDIGRKGNRLASRYLFLWFKNALGWIPDRRFDVSLWGLSSFCRFWGFFLVSRCSVYERRPNHSKHHHHGKYRSISEY